MKLIQLSDLHLGKRLKECSLLSDQRHILNEILLHIDREAPDGILLAGDIYDKAVPSAEAVELFDQFLSDLASRRYPVFLIAGNHDSPERIAFGGRLMEKSRVYLSPVYHGEVKPIRLMDEYGPVDLYLLPFVKPAHVRACFPEEKIESYTDAVRCAIAHMELDEKARKVLLCHQFVTGGERCDSEISVGGSDNVDADVFQPFDYVALGHLHGPQQVSRESIRYSGSPLKYSFSEVSHQKSLTVVELKEKGDLSLRTIPLTPLRELQKLRGGYEELMARDRYEAYPYRDAYLQITLTDEEEIPEALSCLRLIYPNILKLDYDNARSRQQQLVEGAAEAEQRSPLALFAELYELQNNRPMNEQQERYLQSLIEKLQEVQP